MPRKPRHSASIHDADLAAALRRRGVAHAETFMADFASAVTESLTDGKAVELRFFGSFLARDHAATTGRNPRTGKPTHIPQHRRIIFRASTVLLDALNRRRRRRRLGHG